nr:MAG TPA: hypothetical protein [Caudoviricetes sp.]
MYHFIRNAITFYKTKNSVVSISCPYIRQTFL